MCVRFEHSYMEPSRLWCRSGHGVLGEVGGSVRAMRGPGAGKVKKALCAVKSFQLEKEDKISVMGK